MMCSFGEVDGTMVQRVVGAVCERTNLVAYSTVGASLIMCLAVMWGHDGVRGVPLRPGEV